MNKQYDKPDVFSLRRCKCKQRTGTVAVRTNVKPLNTRCDKTNSQEGTVTNRIDREPNEQLFL